MPGLRMVFSLRMLSVVTGAALLAGCGAPPRSGAGHASSDATVVSPTAAVASNTSARNAASADAAAENKIAPMLLAVANRVRATANGTEAAALSDSRVHVSRRREIEIYVHVREVTPPMKAALAGAGARDIRASAPLRTYQAWASPVAIERVAKLPGVLRISAPAYAFPRSGAAFGGP
ncbi:MAG TPA: hypothetical protein VFX38_02620 [Gammaproteobacteria bacterium]|nr:hypothetical protein [Gammaproteobacteria bacterium]